MKERNESLKIRLTRILRFLIEPPGITDLQQKRQLWLLSSLLLIMILLGSASALIQLLTIPGFLPIFLAIAGAIAIMLMAYAFTRVRQYPVAAMITSLTPSLASYAALLTDPQDPSALGFLLISVLLSSILLNRRYTIGIATLNLLGLLLLPILQPAWTYSTIAGIVSYHITIPALIVVSMWHRDAVEADRQKKLHESEARYRRLVEGAPDIVYTFSSKRGGIYYSPQVEQVLGYSVEHLYAHPFLWNESIHPEDRSRINRTIREFGLGRSFDIEYRIQDAQGNWHWLQDRSIGRYLVEDEILIEGVASDITHRKQAEEELRLSEARYRSLINSQTEVIARSDLTGRLTFVNDAYCLVFGRSREELIGHIYLDRVFPEDQSVMLAAQEALLLPPYRTQTETRNITAQGVRWFSWDNSAVSDESGRIIELQGVGRDITERKQLDDTLRRQEKTATEFQKKLRTLHEVNLELSKIESLDELSHAAVEMGLRKLGFERLALFFIEEGKLLVGTYGTDEKGDIRDERHVREEISERKNRFVFDWLKARTRSTHLRNVTLHGAGRDLDKKGSNVLAIVWDGIHSIGMLATDNYLSQSPLQPFAEDLLVMYGNLVGHLITRIRNEQALRESERRYRVLFEESPISIWEEDFSLVKQRIDALRAQGVTDFQEYFTSHSEEVRACAALVKVVDVNQAALKIYYAKKKTDMLDSLKNLLANSESLVGFKEELVGIAHGKTALYREDTDKTLAGKSIELSLSWRVAPGHEETYSKVIVSIVDITERKRAEDALRENEAIFSSFLEHSPVYVFFKDKEIRSLRLSRNYEQMLGMPLDDLLGKTMDDLFPSELAKSMVADDRRILNEARRIDVTEEFNGRIYETTKFPVLKDGKPHLLAGFTLDVTERKRAEEKLRLSEERYRTLAQNLPDSALLLFDQDLRFMIADGPEIEAAGFSRKKLEGKRLHEALPPEFAQTMEPGMRRALAGEKFYAELPNEDRFYRYSYMPIRDQTGEVSLAMILATNITKRKRMEDILFEEKERAEITLHSIGDAVITTDIHARIEYLNPIAENLTGWKLEEALGQPLENVFRIIEEGSRQPAASPVQRCLEQGKVVGLANHSLLIRRDGREFAIDDSAAPIRNRRGEMIGVVLVFHDVTEQRRLSQQVAHDAMHDSLTGLVNRREFEKRLARALVNTKERDVSHILCYLDLDQFKIVNDTAGHAAGDELLKQVSGLLAGLFRQRDTLARLGGDEFGLLLENCRLDQAVVISTEIIAKIRNFPFVWAGNSFQVGASIGIVPITSATESITQLLSQADIACYSAKDLGRGRMYVYQTEDRETTQRHNEILQAARMRDAVVNDQFRLYCQPIAQLTGEPSDVRHYEILLRMASGGERLVLPSKFIPSAERYGLMPAIDRWVIRETFLTLSKHDIQGMQIAINLSGNSLDDETLLEYVLEQLQEFSIPPEQICFEITETAAIHHLSKAQRFIQAFRERNGKIALDDFGSGFSSFRYLKSLPVDFIKIDGSFVSDMLSNQADYAMVQAMTEIAHTLGIEIIAEHALDAETIKCLSEIGAEYAQGFGIGNPIPFESVWDA